MNVSVSHYQNMSRCPGIRVQLVKRIVMLQITEFEMGSFVERFVSVKDKLYQEQRGMPIYEFNANNSERSFSN